MMVAHMYRAFRNMLKNLDKTDYRDSHLGCKAEQHNIGQKETA